MCDPGPKRKPWTWSRRGQKLHGVGTNWRQTAGEKETTNYNTVKQILTNWINTYHIGQRGGFTARKKNQSHFVAVGNFEPFQVLIKSEQSCIVWHTTLQSNASNHRICEAKKRTGEQLNKCFKLKLFSSKIDYVSLVLKQRKILV